MNINDLFPGEKPYFFENVRHTRTIDNFTEIYGSGESNIKYKEDFLDENDIEEALAIIKSYPVLDYRDHCYGVHQVDDFVPTPNFRSFSNKIATKMKNFAEQEFDTTLTIDREFLFMVHPTGSYLHPHTDILDIHYETNDPSRDAGPSQEEQIAKFPNMWSGHLSMLIYLNDDYEDGYLYFPEQDYVIKPKRGSIILFPGSLYYVHGVTKITSGIRYTLSQWARFELNEIYNK